MEAGVRDFAVDFGVGLNLAPVSGGGIRHKYRHYALQTEGEMQCNNKQRSVRSRRHMMVFARTGNGMFIFYET